MTILPQRMPDLRPGCIVWERVMVVTQLWLPEVFVSFTPLQSKRIFGSPEYITEINFAMFTG